MGLEFEVIHTVDKNIATLSGWVGSESLMCESARS